MKHETFLLLALCTLTGCGSLHQATQLVHDIQQDSTYHQHIRYDSIYIYQSHEKDYRRGHPEPRIRHPELVSGSDQLVSGSVAPDTVIIKDISIEYRYKLLRDTIHIIQRDSIPYPVTVVETREVRYTPWWSKVLAWIGALCLAFLGIKLLIRRGIT